MLHRVEDKGTKIAGRVVVPHPLVTSRNVEDVHLRRKENGAVRMGLCSESFEINPGEGLVTGLLADLEDDGGWGGR